MTIQITIIGLGQIGASIGLALADKKETFIRVGHDKDPGVSRKAQKLGAVDKISYNLPASVEGADIVLLSLPVDQIRDTLAAISPDLKENVVVVDTGPAKEAVAAWARELLGTNRHYIGLTPVINPAYLIDTQTGVDAARADLFVHGLMAVISPPRTASDAIKLAADLTRLIGAEPLFADPVEIDSLMAATHTLPQLVSAALLNATTDQPGWREGRKLAGRAYAEVTSPIGMLDHPDTVAQSAMLTKENTLRVLDNVIAALQTLRGDLQGDDMAGLQERLERAHQARLKWWKERQSADWANEEIPDSMSHAATSSEMFNRLLGIGRKREKK